MIWTLPIGFFWEVHWLEFTNTTSHQHSHYRGMHPRTPPSLPSSILQLATLNKLLTAIQIQAISFLSRFLSWTEKKMAFAGCEWEGVVGLSPMWRWVARQMKGKVHIWEMLIQNKDRTGFSSLFYDRLDSFLGPNQSSSVSPPRYAFGGFLSVTRSFWTSSVFAMNLLLALLYYSRGVRISAWMPTSDPRSVSPKETPERCKLVAIFETPSPQLLTETRRKILAFSITWNQIGGIQ